MLHQLLALIMGFVIIWAAIGIYSTIRLARSYHKGYKNSKYYDR